MRLVTVQKVSLTAALALALPGIARGATINVTTTDDSIAADGVCSLREAVIAANTDSASSSGSGGCTAGSGTDTILVPAGTYRLTRNGGTVDTSIPDPTAFDLDVQAPATIRGAGAKATTIDANGIDRAIDGYASLTVEDMTITGGRAPNGNVTVSDGGGGIRASDNLTITDCILVDNRAAPGTPGAGHTGAAGAAFTFGEFGSRGGDGGAVWASAALTVSGTRFERNFAGTGGAGGSATGPAGAISNDRTAVINGGAAAGGAGGKGGDGGAVYAADGASITGSTFINDAAGGGGAGGAATGGAGGGYGFVQDNMLPSAAAGRGGGALGLAGGPGGAGGALYVGRGATRVTESTFTGNLAGGGGDTGKATGGRGGLLLELTGAGGSALANPGSPGGNGGAIATAANTGALTLTSSTLSGDRAGSGSRGGAAVGGSNGGGTFAGNPPDSVGSFSAGQATGGDGGAGGSGGAVAASGGGRLVNVTVDGSSSAPGGDGGTATAGSGTPATTKGGHGGAGGAGGAVVDLAADTNLDVINATLSGNAFGAGGAAGAPGGAAGSASGGGALARLAGTLTLTASITSGNDAAACVAPGGSIADGGDNVRAGSDPSCPGAAGDAGLGTLRDNGGAVFTRAIGAGGAAVNVESNGACPDTDARGAKRPAGAACDAGAYELTPPTASTGAAKGIGKTGGTLTGTVDPHGPPATVRFEYGKTTKYGAKTALQTLNPGFGGRPVSAAIGGYTKGTIVHYRVLVATADGSAAGADARFTVGVAGSSKGGGPGSKDKTPPKLSKVSLSVKRFAVSSKPTAVSARKKPKTKKVPHGTTFHLKVSEKSSVTFAIALKTTGRKVKKTVRKKGSKKKTIKTVCTARGRHRVTRKTRCTRYLAAGTLRRTLKTGSHTVAFSGRIGHKALKPGTYRVSIRATDHAKNLSKTTTLTFTIVHG